ncbi:hypothetical protein E4U42_003760 [Claviceps africana]|uniref:Zn(2)-C6 fungal-type domain-containing protein n=1 Tax=Claviceps africana TaxID=83212 RepID=A0A8K0J625_9HYPO|nr:hypothetical protein E4U42_003760 [Claviceps africana]
MSSNPSGTAPLRTLLSREPVSAESSESNAGRKRRDVVVAACEDCRKRKAKMTKGLQCDAQRPACSACVARGRACTYATNPSETRGSALKRKHDSLDRDFQELQRSHDALQQLVQVLQSRDEKDALAIFRRIRQHEDVETILEHLHASDVLLELQMDPSSRSAGSSSSTHQQHIPTSLLTADDSSFPRLGREGIQVVPSHGPCREVRYSPLFGVLPSISNAFHHTKPRSLVKILDSRMESVIPSRWTHVPADDDVLRDLLGRYFIQEYVRIACFHKDQFLDDMLSGSIQFCSSLLVNAILALSCYCYHEAAVNKEKLRQLRGLGYECLAEAKKLWDMEQEGPTRITTIQAAMVLSVTLHVCSAEALGVKYARAAVAMAVGQGLFRSSDTERISGRLRRAREFTAWCLHNWIILQGHQFVISSNQSSQCLPLLPDPEVDPEWYGEMWMEDLSTMTKFCVQHARLFKARSDMLSIYNQIACHLSHSHDKAVS